MPLPKPKKDEKESDFIKRCMSNSEMNNEFPPENQRFAVCNQIYQDALAKPEKKNDNILGDKKMITLKEQYKAFKSGKQEAPTIHVNSDIVTKKVTLTKQVIDRDGEVISVSGMDIEAFKSNPVLLDAHAMHGSVVDNVLGNVDNVRKNLDDDGIAIIEGDLSFADTPRGNVAKTLVNGGYVRSVSIGFRVMEYDVETNTITKSELFELSLVSVPANPEAKIKSVDDVVKKLDNYEDIHPKIKEYRRFFMSDELCEKLEYKKTGKELIDLKNISELIQKRLDNAANLQSEEQHSEPVDLTDEIIKGLRN